MSMRSYLPYRVIGRIIVIKVIENGGRVLTNGSDTHKAFNIIICRVAVRIT